MSQSLTLKIKGLYTYPSDFSEVPDGALARAENIILDRDSIAEPRRGFTYATEVDFLTQEETQVHFGDANDRVKRIFFYQNNDICYYAGKLAYYNPTEGVVPYSGTYQSPTVDVPIRSAQANSNFYFTTDRGVQKLDAIISQPVLSGVPQGLDLSGSIALSRTPTASTTTGSPVLTSVSSVAGLAIGMGVSGTNIPANTYVVGFNANTVTMSNNAIAGGTGITVTFSVPTTWLETSANNGECVTAARILFCYTDANDNFLRGAPSNIAQVTNATASSASVIWNFTIPDGITGDYFYQIYRSHAVKNGQTPNDEGGLVYQGAITAADIAYGQISVLDIVPDDLRGATIYTAASQEGIVNANYLPPLAQDITEFRNYMFYGNTSTLQSYSLTLLSVGSPAGLQVGDTVTVDGVMLTAGSSENASTGTFKVTPVFLLSTTATTNSTTTLASVAVTTGIQIGYTVSGLNIPPGTFVTNIVGSTITMSQAATDSVSGKAVTFTGASASQAIRDTAQSLVRVMNRYASSTTYGYYLSGPNDLPGKMLIQARSVGDPVFSVNSSRSTCWSPELPETGTSQQSDNDMRQSYIYFSKFQQPEAVPLGNFLPVGSADKAILRIISLRDSLFILKEDGIFYLSGTDQTNFQIWPLDYTAVLISPESAVALNNQIYCFTTQGVVQVNQNGTSIISRPIEGDLNSLIAINLHKLKTMSFGVAYESARAYYFFTITNQADEYPTQYWRYNYITNTWTHSFLSKHCGGIDAEDRLCLGNASMNILDQERKSLNYTDYADYQSTQQVLSVVGKTVEITSVDTISIGSVITQGLNVFGTVVSIDKIAGTCETSLETELVPGDADVLSPISCIIEWVPHTFANPGISKQFREVTPLFLSDFNGIGYMGFETDIYPSETFVPVLGSNVGAWGLFAWGGPLEAEGGAPWGGIPIRRPIRVSVPRNHQRCSLVNISFTHSFAYSAWKLQGVSLIGNNISERVSN